MLTVTMVLRVLAVFRDLVVGSIAPVGRVPDASVPFLVYTCLSVECLLIWKDGTVSYRCSQRVTHEASTGAQRRRNCRREGIILDISSTAMKSYDCKESKSLLWRHSRRMDKGRKPASRAYRSHKAGSLSTLKPIERQYS